MPDMPCLHSHVLRMLFLHTLLGALLTDYYSMLYAQQEERLNESLYLDDDQFQLELAASPAPLDLDAIDDEDGTDHEEGQLQSLAVKQ